MTGWTEKPEIATVSETIAVLGGRGISAELVPDRASALDAVVRKIPEGSEVVTDWPITDGNAMPTVGDGKPAAIAA